MELRLFFFLSFFFFGIYSFYLALKEEEKVRLHDGDLSPCAWLIEQFTFDIVMIMKET